MHHDLSQPTRNIVSTICFAWVLDLKDGRQIGLTDHDQKLQFNNVEFIPQHSLNASDQDFRKDFAADNGSFETIFEIPDLDSESLKDGLLDGATLTQYRVDWRQVDTAEIIASGRIGKITIKGQKFTAEWLGHATQLDRSTGRVFSKLCDAEFGDGRCGLSAASFPDGTICPKTLAACGSQFNNAANFRGFPYLLGDDALQAAPQIGERRDGSSRYR